MSAEPRPVSLSVRAGYDASLGLDEFQIEARFADGQKYSIATVDGEHPNLAHLIAAAPALLEACHGLLVHIALEAPDRISAKDEPLVVARAAIAKARGKEPT